MLHELFVDPNMAQMAVASVPHLQALIGAGSLLGQGQGLQDDSSLGMASFGRSLPVSSSAQQSGSLLRYGPGDAKSMPMYASHNSPHHHSQHHHHHHQAQHSIYGPPPAADHHYQHSRGSSGHPLAERDHYLEGVPAGEVGVPLPALVGFGVPPETVKQLIDMQTYLFQQVPAC